MKKLTAGIFTVLMGLVTVNAAEAFVASKGYVDEKVSGATTSIATLTQTVADNKTEAAAATQEVADALAAYKETNDTAVTALDGRLDEAETDITALQGEVEALSGDGANSVAAQIAAAVATEESARKAADKTLQDNIDAINNADTGILKQAQTYADTAEADAIAAAAEAAKIYIDETELTTSQNAQNASIKEAYEAADATLQSKIDAINNETTGILAGAKAYTDTEIGKIDTEYKAADTAINEMIGTVADGKTVVEMIADAQTAATYDDTAVKAGIKANADAIDAIEASEYATSGITAAKVSAYDAYDGKITANTAAAAAAQAQADKGVEDAATAQAAADAAQATANAAIPAPTQECSNKGNKCVLTSGETGYAWEVIQRATDATLENQCKIVFGGGMTIPRYN